MHKNMSHDNVADILIVTALKSEHDAVLRYLDSPEKVSRHHTVHQAYLPHENSETGYQVVVLCIGKGTANSATTVTQALNDWKPAAIILTGFMGGVKAENRCLGDLIIAEQIVGYELGKAKSTGTERRLQVRHSTPKIIDKVRHFQDDKWVLECRKIALPDGEIRLPMPQVHFGDVASGDKVIADKTTMSELQSYWSNLIGVDMEGFGTANAVYQADSPPQMLMVKGICDWADPEKNDKWQAYAANVAAAYVINFLKSKPIECRGKSQVQPTVVSRPRNGNNNQVQPTVVSRPRNGNNNLEFYNRLGDNHKDLALYFSIKLRTRELWREGTEGEKIIEWLENLDKLQELPEALTDIGRTDLVDLAKSLISNTSDSL
jgi:nucleoside phosphorylase